ncbi:DUF4191 domain-containing protein [Bifidobacterium sp. UBA6881]|uniref:DUF4191 domain-containing protein n=1 Tax=Bifidobacterium sp. UBA6881 TaxID=1946109 RepID=UPI000EBFE3DE|nr:DUF4191 domain-containing protein [Bifidobacterium sp. UBA6881]HAH52875.1 DUF4191 domain-containing protein [Bifidobacterium sp.]HAK71686.1 DUF4191 domain-containing protein [Bifidobacterium sp.]HCA74813.1 DUF4191 domain-containing protein [Bifidobacterium sp.]HCH22425.1 DUF4191 domain-containing protein [Bifidobacterium sp.]
MADKEEKKKKKAKKDSTLKQIIQIFKYTKAEDSALPWLCAAAFIVPIVVFVVLGIVFKWSVIGWIFSIILAIMIGMLLFTMTLTNRADKVGYAKLEGRPGAAISVLGNISKAGFNFPQEPVWVDPKTKDAIWRGTGYNGIYLLGEGEYGRVKRGMDRQEQSIKGVTAGSDIPVYRVYVGKGKNQTSLKDLRKTILKCKTYEPTHHKNKLVAAIHPRTRFVLTKTELSILNDRLRTLQMKNGMNLPKGVDPTHPQRISRRAMRGR